MGWSKIRIIGYVIIICLLALIISCSLQTNFGKRIRITDFGVDTKYFEGSYYAKIDFTKYFEWNSYELPLPISFSFSGSSTTDTIMYSIKFLDDDGKEIPLDEYAFHNASGYYIGYASDGRTPIEPSTFLIKKNNTDIFYISKIPENKVTLLFEIEDTKSQTKDSRKITFFNKVPLEYNLKKAKSIDSPRIKNAYLSYDVPDRVVEKYKSNIFSTGDTLKLVVELGNIVHYGNIDTEILIHWGSGGGLNGKIANTSLFDLGITNADGSYRREPFDMENLKIIRTLGTPYYNGKSVVLIAIRDLYNYEEDYVTLPIIFDPNTKSFSKSDTLITSTNTDINDFFEKNQNLGQNVKQDIINSFNKPEIKALEQPIKVDTQITAERVDKIFQKLNCFKNFPSNTAISLYFFAEGNRPTKYKYFIGGGGKVVDYNGQEIDANIGFHTYKLDQLESASNVDNEFKRIVDVKDLIFEVSPSKYLTVLTKYSKVKSCLGA